MVFFPGGSDAKASAYKRPGVQSLGGEDMEIHSTILALRIPKIEKTGGLQFMGPQRVGHDWATNTQLGFFGNQLGFW